jgi:hypothetical protein
MTYIAITRRNGHWRFVCTGVDPEETYRAALEILDVQHDTYPDDERGVLSPIQEHQLDTLRVVPAATARHLLDASPRAA